MTQHEGSPQDALEQGRPERPLGRGLADVSHVFLSQRSRGAERDPTAPRPERPLPREQQLPREQPLPHEPSPTGTPLLLQHVAQATREQVAAALKEFVGTVEAGMTVIDEGIPCPPYDEIDLLAVDRLCQLTIIDFDIGSSDNLLMRGIGHFDWFTHNIPIVRRMYRGQSINFTLQPRVVLLAPELSPRTRGVARQIARPDIYWLRYHFVEAAGQPAVFFEPLPQE